VMNEPDVRGSLERLAHIQAITELKARYFRFLDTQDWNLWRELFADDVWFQFRDTELAGADALVEYVATLLKGAVTVHHGHMPEISLRSSVTARGIWSMEDILLFPDGRATHGYGHYHETYERSRDEWRIKTMKLTRLHIEDLPPRTPKLATDLGRRPVRVPQLGVTHGALAQRGADCRSRHSQPLRGWSTSRRLSRPGSR
jgi:hypothetical protein